mgnify:CR=1 FL=1
MKSRFFIPGRGRIPLLPNRQRPPVGATSWSRSVQVEIAAWTPLLQNHRRPAVGANSDSRHFPPHSNPPSSQRGSALFVAVFLIAVVAVLAAAVALTSVTQQLGSARALQAEQAWYAAVGRIELEAPGMLTAGSCPGSGTQTIAGFTTTFECSADEIDEGGMTYSVFSVSATAQRGNAASGSLVRRTARAQFTNRN